MKSLKFHLEWEGSRILDSTKYYGDEQVITAINILRNHRCAIRHLGLSPSLSEGYQCRQCEHSVSFITK